MELSQWDLSILTAVCPGPALMAVQVDQCGAHYSCGLMC